MKYRISLLVAVFSLLSASSAAFAAEGSIKTIVRSRSGGSGIADTRTLVSSEKAAPNAEKRAASEPRVKKVPFGRSGSSAFIVHTFKRA